LLRKQQKNFRRLLFSAALCRYVHKSSRKTNKVRSSWCRSSHRHMQW